jgi:rubrerythrin
MNVELEAIIKNAITQGELSHEFYLQLGNLVTRKETKETFNLLARMEMEHNRLLQSFEMPQDMDLGGEADVAWIEDESLQLLGMKEAPVGVTMHTGGELSEEVYGLSPAESLLIAMKREEGFYRLYQNLADRQPPGKPRTVLETLSRLKRGLKERFEELYNNATFVEVW